MNKVSEVCRYVRSKNAGPFWITVDLFFRDAEAFAMFADAPQLSARAVAALFRVEEATVKRFAVPSLHVVKISFPRLQPQGGVIERDMHGGQHFVRLLDVALSSGQAQT